MSDPKPGICPVHFQEFEIEESTCNTCDGEGHLERQDQLTGEIDFVNCHQCFGKGVGSYPKCQLCDDIEE